MKQNKKKVKKYVLMAELMINDKVVPVTLATYDLIALQKYTAFCNGPEDLLKFMPNDDDFSVRNFLSKHLDLPLSKSNDPFCIKTSASSRAVKLRIIYKDDLDVLIIGKKNLSSRLYELVNISIDDCINNKIPEEKRLLLMHLYNKYYGTSLDKEVQKEISKHYNMDYEYDSRYAIAYRNKWMFIGLSRACCEAVVSDAFKDDRKRFELAFLIKDNTGNLLPMVSETQKNATVEKLDEILRRRKASPSYIRASIRSNAKRINEDIKPRKKETQKSSTICERSIIEYNKEYNKNSKGSHNRKLEEVIFLSEKIENLKMHLESLTNETKSLEKLLERGSFLESDESINARLNFNKAQVKAIKQEIIELEYELNELESNRAVYSDAGFVVEKDKDM